MPGIFFSQIGENAVLYRERCSPPPTIRYAKRGKNISVLQKNFFEKIREHLFFTRCSLSVYRFRQLYSKHPFRSKGWNLSSTPYRREMSLLRITLPHDQTQRNCHNTNRRQNQNRQSLESRLRKIGASGRCAGIRSFAFEPARSGRIPIIQAI